MDQSRQRVINRLKTIKGHIAGIEKMVADGKPCAEVLMQISAVKSSVHKVGVAIIQDNALQCFSEGEDDKLDRSQVEAVIKLFLDYTK